MSDESSDPDLAEERYDPEDNLNAYGSPVVRSPDDININEIVEQSVVGIVHPVRAQFCSCKNTCSKGSGRKKKGCPCRDEGLQCTEQCSCGTKKASCKNKAQVGSSTHDPSTGLNAFERHALAAEEAKREITEFIATLDITQKNALLVDILSNGKGSLDYAKNLVKFGGDIPPAPAEKPPWCTCRVCRPMPHEEENKCCGKVRCVTSYVTFQNTCTDRDVLTMAIRGRCDIRADEPDYSTNSFRKAAYRQYILWR
ncbi:Hypothetical predicted protein [Paramuricea clavata]|uniref:P2X purinoreceptor 7 intracellular domain-containing protein n=1 Tax=Paramuricea clavata TaxID=317549 RepID=A0A7D9DGP7_PARCT|nr:Hypothetical predicted protein [Paramuricea clavata]